jgi:hypothetical protein
MSKLIEHAREELQRAGLFDKDCYDGLIGEAVLRLIETHAKEGHSGASSDLVLSVFQKLAKFQVLTPVTSDAAEWEKIPEERLPWEQRDLWQNKRQSSLFSTDGGKTFFSVGE